MIVRHKRTAAFTIVELLVASAITLGIVVLLGVIFGSITRTASRANQRTDAFRDARAALQMMARDLTGLVRNQRDASGNPITKPAAYLALDNIYADPASGNQQIFALIAAKNSAPGDVCAIGYYCRWDDQGGYNYSLRRFFQDSGATFSNLAKPTVDSDGKPFSPKSAIYLPDPPTTSPPLKDDLLAAYVWNLQIIAYDKSGIVISSYPYVCDPKAATNNPLPAAIEISFKAMSAEAARTVISTKAGADVWMNEGDPAYKRLIAPNVYQFRTRINFDQ